MAGGLLVRAVTGGLGCAKPEGGSSYWGHGEGRGGTEEGVWKVTSCDGRLMDATVTRGGQRRRSAGPDSY